MRFYVKCKIHQTEKIYLKFDKEPQSRANVPLSFTATCPSGIQQLFTNQEVIAEVGIEPIAGAILGGLLFFIDPVLGLIGLFGGLIGVNANEQQKVDNFNGS